MYAGAVATLSQRGVTKSNRSRSLNDAKGARPRVYTLCRSRRGAWHANQDMILIEDMLVRTELAWLPQFGSCAPRSGPFLCLARECPPSQRAPDTGNPTSRHDGSRAGNGITAFNAMQDGRMRRLRATRRTSHGALGAGRTRSEFHQEKSNSVGMDIESERPAELVS